MANESYNKFIKFVDDNLAPHFIDRLTDAVAIQRHGSYIIRYYHPFDDGIMQCFG